MELEEAICQRTFENEHQKAILNVLYTSGWLNRRNTQFLKPFGLTHPQFNVLRILRGQHPNALPLCSVTERMVDHSSNVTRLIEKLLQKSLVTRELNPENRRQVRLQVTPQGLELLGRIDKKMTVQKTQFEKISEGEARELSRILTKLRS